MLFHPSVPLPSRMACYGASGHCVQVSLDLRFQAAGKTEFVAYVDDIHDPRRLGEKGYPVLDFADLVQMEDVGVFVPVFDSTGRREIHERLIGNGIPVLGARGMPHLVHPDAELGEGSIVASTTRVGHTAKVGRGGLVLSDMVAHDVEIGDFCTLAFGSTVLGHVQIGNDVFVGAGAIIHNGTLSRSLTIGDGAVIGAGAVVRRDVEPGQVVVGWSTVLPEGRKRADS